MATDTTAPAPTRSLWISRPWIDLAIGCAGWSLPLLAIAYRLTGPAALALSTTFYSLALVVNYPHYMATVYRAYGAGEWRKYPAYTVWATLALVAIGAAAHVELSWIPILFTAYIMWSPWHYSGQNYGLMIMFARRGGHQLTRRQQQLIKSAFVASYLMLLVSFNTGPSSDPLVLSLGLPASWTLLIANAALLVFAAGAGVGIFALVRQHRGSAITPPLVLLLTQGLWFAAPAVVSTFTGVAAPQTRYSSGVLALMHSAQYLWITQYFAKRERGRDWSAARYWFTVIAGGIMLFLPVPWLAGTLARLDFTASMIIVTAIVNIHHFMIDGVVWKLRDPKVAGALTTDADATSRRAHRDGSRVRLVVATSAALLLIALAGVDQWRYRLASRETDAAALLSAAALTPNDTTIQSRLLRVLIESGRYDEARQRIDQRISDHPSDVTAHVNAGVLARQTGRDEDAVRHWQRALSLNPSQPVVQLYLAEALHELRRPAEAIPLYRAYLESVTADRERAQAHPDELVTVILKFGDALLLADRKADARTQYELAGEIARQTRLAELEQQAKLRLNDTR
ncbi:MAG: tetratricopeptide repeat protein [Cyanobacteria bacterium]|nr:tetratricopeptide repeat protein [Cyanobacteriota bacterium]